MADTKNGISNPGRTLASDRGPGQTNGTVRFAEEVIATIALISAMDVKGVVGEIGTGDVTEDRMIKKHALRGIKIKFIDEDVQIDVSISVKPEFIAVLVAQNVQSCVKKNIENMTGMKVLGVNVLVASIQHKQGTE